MSTPDFLLLKIMALPLRQIKQNLTNGHIGLDLFFLQLSCPYFSGFAISNPLAYGLIQAFGWRWAYGVLAAILCVVCLICCSTLSPANTKELDKRETNSTREEELTEPQQEIPEDSRSEEDLHLRRPTIVFYCILWLLCAITKGLGYHTPHIILVCIVCIYICEQGMQILVCLVVAATYYASSSIW